MDLGLQGKVAIVTGGSEGIGKAAAASMAAEGASVIIAARRADVLEAAASEIREQTGGGVTAVQTDVMVPEQVEALIQRAVDDHGRLDILVNNAGTSAGRGLPRRNRRSLAARPRPQALRLDQDLPPRCPADARTGRRTHHQRHQPGREGAGRRVGSDVRQPSRPASRSQRPCPRSSPPTNILVTTVCIGLIKSGQHETRFKAMQESDPDLTLDQFYSDMGDRVPIGRVGESEEAGDVIAFLASDRASYLTGIAINIDGGTSPVV